MGSILNPVILCKNATLFGKILHIQCKGLSGADPGFWNGGGRGVWVINWHCAHRRCAPLGGLKACPLRTFEILDAFSCNLEFLQFFFVPSFSFF